MTPVAGGYRISGKGSPFASGVDHSAWLMLGGMTQEPQPEWKLFLVPTRDCKIVDTWHTAGMRGTGSKTVVTDNVFVPDSMVLSLAELRDGKSSRQRALLRCYFPHAVFLLCTDLIRCADARRRPGRL